MSYIQVTNGDVLRGSLRRNATPNSRYGAHNPDPSQLRCVIHLGDHESSRDGSMFQSEPVRLLGLPKRKFTPPNRLGAMCGSHLWPEKATLYENGANALKAEPRNKEKRNSNLSPEVNLAWSQPYPRTTGFGKPVYLVSLKLVMLSFLSLATERHLPDWLVSRRLK